MYYPDFIATNQEARADNLIPGDDKQVHLDKLRADVRGFRSANTEGYSDIIPGTTPVSFLYVSHRAFNCLLCLPLFVSCL